MKNVPISDPATLKRVSALSNAVDKAAAAVESARGSISDCQSRKAALVDALAEHAASKPTPLGDMSGELSSILAANPAAAKSADWQGQLKKDQAAHEQAMAAWSGKHTVFEQALAKVEAEESAGAVVIEAAEQAHDQAWAEFVREAYAALADEAEARFADLVASCLGPLAALSKARTPHTGMPALSGARKTFEGELSIRKPPADVDGHPTHGGTRLFPIDSRAEHAAYLTALRAALGAAVPPIPR